MIKNILKKILPKPIIKLLKQFKYCSFNNLKKSKQKHRTIIKNPNLKELKKIYNNTWKNNSIPLKQLKITEKELPNFINNTNMKFCVALIKKTNLKTPNLLEIGCSTGYFSEIFKRTGIKGKYEGCDYSKEFIKIAKQKYSNIPFTINDATKLNYENKKFDIVISGCCLLHIINYQKAISEAVRVSKEFVIFYRTPILHLKKTIFTKKIGYDLEMLEILFNENELIDLFLKNGLLIQSVKTHSRSFIKEINEPVFVKSYLCKKIK
ncbi:MAG: class I SAM-dependent methyltransferase [Candidatus Pacebacteria bacterium]|nr:class I SAM-dependent methyltransferase [Candidatus Paceibacterota bacterium]